MNNSIIMKNKSTIKKPIKKTKVTKVKKTSTKVPKKQSKAKITKVKKSAKKNIVVAISPKIQKPAVDMYGKLLAAINKVDLKKEICAFCNDDKINPNPPLCKDCCIYDLRELVKLCNSNL